MASAMGATLGLLSGTVAPARKEKEEDEYARVLPMVSTTRTGGIIGGLVGRF